MYIFYFDCGTSKTRGYLIKDGKIIEIHKKDIGSKDVSIQNDKSVLINGMKIIYDTLLINHNLEDKDICKIYASGMITSPFGLKEVPHAVTPIDKWKMKESIHVHYEDNKFNRDINLILGLKTTKSTGTFENIENINNVRGEEIEVMGILNHIPELWKSSKYIVIIPGSHTHTLMLEGETILDIYSTFSGELFHAVTTSTILSSSTELDNNSDIALDFNSNAVAMGCRNLKKYGLARALYIVHAMKIFDVGDNKFRRECLNAVINGSVVESLKLNMNTEWKDIKRIAVYGDENMLLTYKEAIKEFLPELSIEVLALNRDNYNCAFEGLITIINS